MTCRHVGYEKRLALVAASFDRPGTCRGACPSCLLCVVAGDLGGDRGQRGFRDRWTFGGEAHPGLAVLRDLHPGCRDRGVACGPGDDEASAVGDLRRGVVVLRAGERVVVIVDRASAKCSDPVDLRW